MLRTPFIAALAAGLVGTALLAGAAHAQSQDFFVPGQGRGGAPAQGARPPAQAPAQPVPPFRPDRLMLPGAVVDDGCSVYQRLTGGLWSLQHAECEVAAAVALQYGPLTILHPGTPEVDDA